MVLYPDTQWGWYIYLHLPVKINQINVGKYTIHMDPIWDIVDVRRGRVGIFVLGDESFFVGVWEWNG